MNEQQALIILWQAAASTFTVLITWLGLRNLWMTISSRTSTKDSTNPHDPGDHT